MKQEKAITVINLALLLGNSSRWRININSQFQPSHLVVCGHALRMTKSRFIESAANMPIIKQVKIKEKITKNIPMFIVFAC
jgi:hypothetical protein